MSKDQLRWQMFNHLVEDGAFKSDAQYLSREVIYTMAIGVSTGAK
jgi:hypothetical protein